MVFRPFLFTPPLTGPAVEGSSASQAPEWRAAVFQLCPPPEAFRYNHGDLAEAGGEISCLFPAICRVFLENWQWSQHLCLVSKRITNQPFLVGEEGGIEDWMPRYSCCSAWMTLRPSGTLGSNAFESFISVMVNFMYQLKWAQGAQIFGSSLF